MKPRTTQTRFITDEGVDVCVTWNYYPAIRGQRDSLCGVRGAGPPLEPDDPEQLEFREAHDLAGNEVELSKKEIKAAERAAWREME